MNKKAYVSLLVSMMIFGTIGLVRRMLPFSSLTVAAVRSLLGFLLLFFVQIVSKKKVEVLHCPKDLLLISLSGLCLGANWVLLFESFLYTTITVTTVCNYLAPVLVAVLTPFLFRQRFSLWKIGCVLVAFLGLILTSGIFFDTVSADQFRGILCALGTAVLYACVIILNKKTAHVIPMERTLIQMLTGFLCILPFSLWEHDPMLFHARPEEYLLLIVAGFLHTGIAYLLYFSSFSALPVQTVAICSYLDPVVSILLSAIVLHEPISLLTGIGIVLVLGAAFISDFPFPKRKDHQREDI